MVRENTAALAGATRPLPPGTAPIRPATRMAELGQIRFSRFVHGRRFAGGRPSAEADKPPVYAALDLGTNNCRLLIAVPTRPGQFRVIDAFSRIVRLGEGLGRTGRLSRGGDGPRRRGAADLRPEARRPRRPPAAG